MTGREFFRAALVAVLIFAGLSPLLFLGALLGASPLLLILAGPALVILGAFAGLGFQAILSGLAGGR